LESNFHSLSSGTSVNAVPLNSNMYRWLIRGPVARLSAPTT
jgi:hypothetical protein